MFRSRFGHCVAVLGDVLYVMGGCDEDYSTPKTAERYDPETDRWSPIADMNVQRSSASAAALNGNMTIMKQEGIRTNCVAKWMHNLDFMYVRHHANVLSVIAIRSGKNAPLSFAMLVRIWQLENFLTHFHGISCCEVLLK
jgi:N-acetylneuraminic acid mutarotase